MSQSATKPPLTPLPLGQTSSFYDAVRARHSMRGFLSTPLPDETITAILEDAQLSPSNCNTQPWVTHVVSGAARDKLSAALLADVKAQKYSPDFSFSTQAFSGAYAARMQEQGRANYEAQGIARDDSAGRMAAAMNNYSFFNAPHVALLFMPAVGDNVRTAADVGMYAQTFMLALAARGLGSVPQTAVGLFANTVREALGVSEEMKFLFSISFGYPNEHFTRYDGIARAPLAESVTFHR